MKPSHIVASVVVVAVLAALVVAVEVKRVRGHCVDAAPRQPFEVVPGKPQWRCKGKED